MKLCRNSQCVIAVVVTKFYIINDLICRHNYYYRQDGYLCVTWMTNLPLIL